VRDANTGQEMFNQAGLTATSLVSPVSLPNGNYFWNVLGYDAHNNMVLSGGVRFTVQTN
jgi:hypothetical protein